MREATEPHLLSAYCDYVVQVSEADAPYARSEYATSEGGFLELIRTISHLPPTQISPSEHGPLLLRHSVIEWQERYPSCLHCYFHLASPSLFICTSLRLYQMPFRPRRETRARW